MFNRMGDAYAAEDDGCLRRVMAVPLGILYALVITVALLRCGARWVPGGWRRRCRRGLGPAGVRR